jgi:hypothetical protein
VAGDDPRLTEQWQVEVSPLWHLSSSGLAPVHNLSAADRWLPSWRPWPGEVLELALSRPAGVLGPTLTLDRSAYVLSPGRRASEATLSLTLRSSQGGRHRIQLPDAAELTRFAIDGQSRPLALQGRALDLPLVPGSQGIELGWREPSGLVTLYRPAVIDFGTPGVNAETEVRLGPERWVLWTQGPGIGPAVQFWGLLLVMALVAALLARLRLTPLGFLDWLLLGIGLSQVGVWVAALVALWLFALGLRRRLDAMRPPGASIWPRWVWRCSRSPRCWPCWLPCSRGCSVARRCRSLAMGRPPAGWSGIWIAAVPRPSRSPLCRCRSGSIDS